MNKETDRLIDMMNKLQRHDFFGFCLEVAKEIYSLSVRVSELEANKELTE